MKTNSLQTTIDMMVSQKKTMAKKKRGKKSKKKSKLVAAVLEQQSREKSDTAPVTADIPHVLPQALTRAGIRQYVENEHVHYMKTEVERLGDDEITGLTDILSSLFSTDYD